MPDNGMQCVMFTHQDTGVWSDMVGIFWAAGLQVVAAWYIATETTSELKKGGYVQGTVILMLRKRLDGKRPGFKQRILPAVRTEVQRQIETMMHLNEEVKDKHGEPVFNDSDLQMAGYAAALKVLTAYTSIGDEDVTSFALRPRQRGEVTVVDEIVQQAAEAANSLLVPEGLGCGDLGQAQRHSAFLPAHDGHGDNRRLQARQLSELRQGLPGSGLRSSNGQHDCEQGPSQACHRVHLTGFDRKHRDRRHLVGPGHHRVAAIAG